MGKLKWKQTMPRGRQTLPRLRLPWKAVPLAAARGKAGPMNRMRRLPPEPAVAQIRSSASD
eukprot:1658991-Lingulodinium_polyedra.AAC.1